MAFELLHIQKGGVLVEIDDNKIPKTIDIPNPTQLHDRKCDLQEGVTLREIFTLLNKNIEFWDSTLGNWCREIVAEGLKTSLKVAQTHAERFTTDYLELYQFMQISKMNEEFELEFSNRLQFHGIGTYIEDDPTTGVKKGDTTAIGISLTPANELAHLKIRLNSKMEIWFDDYDSERSETRSRNLDNPKRLYQGITFPPSLFEILYGIIWELSFHGSPEKRHDERKELLRRVDEVRKGTAKMVPWKEALTDTHDHDA